MTEFLVDNDEVGTNEPPPVRVPGVIYLLDYQQMKRCSFLLGRGTYHWWIRCGSDGGLLRINCVVAKPLHRCILLLALNDVRDNFDSLLNVVSTVPLKQPSRVPNGRPGLMGSSCQRVVEVVQIPGIAVVDLVQETHRLIRHLLRIIAQLYRVHATHGQEAEGQHAQQVVRHHVEEVSARSLTMYTVNVAVTGLTNCPIVRMSPVLASPRRRSTIVVFMRN